MVALSALGGTQEIRANLPSRRSHRNEVLQRHERHAHQLLLLQWPEARAVNTETATALGQQAGQQARQQGAIDDGHNKLDAPHSKPDAQRTAAAPAQGGPCPPAPQPRSWSRTARRRRAGRRTAPSSTAWPRTAAARVGQGVWAGGGQLGEAVASLGAAGWQRGRQHASTRHNVAYFSECGWSGTPAVCHFMASTLQQTPSCRPAGSQPPSSPPEC